MKTITAGRERNPPANRAVPATRFPAGAARAPLHPAPVLTLLAALAATACMDLALTPAQTPASMELSPGDTLVVEGDQITFVATVYDSDGQSLGSPPAWAPPDWEISDPEILQIDENGQAIALGGGQIRVIASVAGLAAWTSIKSNPANVRLNASAVYLNQAVQNVDGTVPIIAGRDALLRVFATGDETSFYEPKVAARFYNEGRVVHSAIMTAFSDVLPSEVHEGRLDLSYNTLIPGEVIQPGLGMVVEVDPEGVVPLDAGSETRVPATGVLDVDVVEMPLHIQTIVPTILSRAPNERVFNWTRHLDADSRQMAFARTVLPIGDMEVRVRETYTSTADLTEGSGWNKYIREIRALYHMEGDVGYYYGVVTLPPGSAYGGLGYVGFPVSVGRDGHLTFTHELGHNMNLRHAPCGGAGGPDPNYPYEEGSTGIWGYDISRSRLINPGDYKDVMGYCTPDWISDYHFVRAYQHRRATEVFPGTPGQPGQPPDKPEAPPVTSTLLLWGSVGPEEFLMEPAFLIESAPNLPAGGGPYRLEGIGDDGRTVFSFDFTPDPVEFGGAHFHFAVPYDPGRDGPLERVVLTGPEGVVVLEDGSTPPMTIVRSLSTGRIRAILRDGDQGLNLIGPGTEVMVSDGLPGAVR